MKTDPRPQPHVAYLKQLIGAGFEGISSTRNELGGRVLTHPLKAVVWTPAAIGATVGALGARLSGNRKASTIAMGGLVGGIVGSGAALAWASRGFAGLAARRSIRLVSAVRDTHWLEIHPIDYA
jgi:hypothetical protein